MKREWEIESKKTVMASFEALVKSLVTDPACGEFGRDLACHLISGIMQLRKEIAVLEKQALLFPQTNHNNSECGCSQENTEERG